MLSRLFVCLAVACATGVAAVRPHILFILVDDLGHSELGYQRAATPSGPTKEVSTPSIDALVHDGVQLDRHYVHKFCSPSRCAIQSGRAPIHVNAINAAPEVHNPSDPVGGFAGIPRNMTGMAEVMKRAGYRTHMVGKWDVGMATPDHTPVGRGYETSLIYFHHANDYWTFGTGKCGKTSITDIWNKSPNVTQPYGRPGKALTNVEGCTQNNQSPKGKCVYEDALFENRVKRIIRDHDVTAKEEPLFLFWATHIVHGPLQVPDDQYAKFSFIDTVARRKYHSMVNYIDGAIGRVIDLLKARGMYNDTFIVFSSDNGGPLPAGNNYPLKGGKFSNWEGGIRVNAFVSGGHLPSHVRGTTQSGLIAGWDWYATFGALANVTDIVDHRAAAAELPPLDSVNMWPLLSGASTTSPRTQLEIGSNEGGEKGRRTGATEVGGLLRPPYKLILGEGPGNTLDMAGWPGPKSPNSTGHANYKSLTQACGRTASTGCLYDVYSDPSERHNLAQAKPDVFNQLLAEVDRLQKGVYSPSRGDDSAGEACAMATGEYGGFWGPFLE